MTDTTDPPRGQATVLRLTRKGAVVELGGVPGAPEVECAVRGRLHAGKSRETSPVAVGDDVVMERGADGAVAIAKVLPRRTVLLRPEVHGRWRRQVLVANADRAVLVFSHDLPAPRAGLVDRLLVACHAGGVPPVLVFNKADLAPAAETEALIRVYERLGYDVLRTSADRPGSEDAIRERLVGRRSVVAGPSGTGKTTLVNRAVPGVRLRTGEISRASGKGLHTTTAAQLVRIPGGDGLVVDTPGVREFGLVGIAPEDLELQFPEFPVPAQCGFRDCRHRDEPRCAVRAAVADGRVAASRHESYLALLEEVESDARNETESGRRAGHAQRKDRGARR